MNDDQNEMADALETAGLLQAEYPDQMAARSCTCEPDAVCGAHRLLARYIELNAAFVQRGKERREVQAELRELRAACGGLSPEAVEWAIRIAAAALAWVECPCEAEGGDRQCHAWLDLDELITPPFGPDDRTACPPEVRAQILQQGREQS